MKKPRHEPRTKPTGGMIRVASSLYPSGPEREAFLEALLAGESRSQAIVVLQDRPEIGAFPKERRQPWQPSFVERLVPSFRPGQHPLYEKGAFYSMDASSAVAASLMLAIPEAPRRVLDVCAAPGGKGIFAWRAFRPELLVANEIMRKRHAMLIGNLTRCAVGPAQVAAADPSVWAKEAPDAFDLAIVDAPCSGQSLPAKGERAPAAFDPAEVDTCVGRQRRILGNVVRAVRPGGHLLYLTCTFGKKENEKVIEWLRGEHPDLVPLERPEMERFRSPYAEFPCYRVMPTMGLGAGSFACLLRRGEGGPREEFPASVPGTWRSWDQSP